MCYNYQKLFFIYTAWNLCFSVENLFEKIFAVNREYVFSKKKSPQKSLNLLEQHPT